MNWITKVEMYKLINGNTLNKYVKRWKMWKKQIKIMQHKLGNGKKCVKNKANYKRNVTINRNN